MRSIALGGAAPQREMVSSKVMRKLFEGFERISTDPELMGGKPCIRGMRLSVQRVLEILAQNPSWEELRLDYPELEEEDIRQALAFAASLLTDRIIPLSLSAA